VANISGFGLADLLGAPKYKIKAVGRRSFFARLALFLFLFVVCPSLFFGRLSRFPVASGFQISVGSQFRSRPKSNWHVGWLTAGG
jgi:hypothetical protein